MNKRITLFPCFYALALILAVFTLWSCNGSGDSGTPSPSGESGGTQTPPAPQPGNPADKPEPAAPNVAAPSAARPQAENVDPKEYVKYEEGTSDFIQDLFPADCPLDNKMVTFLLFMFHGRGGDEEDIQERLKAFQKGGDEPIKTPYFIVITTHAGSKEIKEDLVINIIEKTTKKESILTKYKVERPLFAYFRGGFSPTGMKYSLVDAENTIKNIQMLCKEIRELDKQKLSNQEFKKRLAAKMDAELIPSVTSPFGL